MKPPSEITTHINITDDHGNHIGDGTITIPITYGKPIANNGRTVSVPIVPAVADGQLKPANGERILMRKMLESCR